jgi:hypothetical protein
MRCGCANATKVATACSMMASEIMASVVMSGHHCSTGCGHSPDARFKLPALAEARPTILGPPLSA